MATTTTDTAASFTPIQHRVLSLLATGSTISAAARACDLDRTTIHHWSRTNPAFAEAADDAAADAIDAYRTAAQEHAEAALKALRQILDNPDAPASVRCKAALFILNAVKPDAAMAPPKVSAGKPNSTQFNTSDSISATPAPPAPRPVSTQFNTFNTFSAAAPTPAPQPGRNSPCPCQSGRKYKQCCLLKNQVKGNAASAA